MLTTEIGIFEAKTKLSELVRRAERGEHFLIKRRGKIAAKIIPSDENAHTELAARDNPWLQLIELKKKYPLGTPEEIKTWINEGRT